METDAERKRRRRRRKKVGGKDSITAKAAV
jgi:hypothetical protein